MSNETDLTWLARNVHEWPDDKEFICYSMNDGCAIFHEHNKNCATWYHKDQWLSRRAELQNKPSWSDAPEWANWIAQSPTDDRTGIWCFFSGEPADEVNGIWSCSTGKALTARSGLILGHWRDTLERRPKKSRAELEVELVKAAFEPFTSIEDNQDKKMQQDNGWFERGELPPAGIECEARTKDGWSRVRTIGLDSEGNMVVEFLEDVIPYHGNSDPCYFRPIRTERDKAIDEMKQHCPHHGSWDSVGRIYAEALYDAGYRKEPK